MSPHPPYALALLLALLLPATVAAQGEGNTITLERDRALDLYVLLKSQLNKMPGLRTDGVVLTQSYVLDKLKEKLNTDGVEVTGLQLTPAQGVITLSTSRGITAKHTVAFQFLPVDWPNRTVHIRFSQKSEALSETLLGQLLGTLAIGAFESATGKTGLNNLTEKRPYVSIQGDVLSVRLDQAPSLAPYLNSQIMGYKPFDFVGIKRLNTEQDQLRVVLALQKSAP